MKTLILTTAVIALAVTAGFAVKYSLTEMGVQENITTEETEAEHEHDEDHEHDHSVEIEGSAMKALSIQEVADLWEIDSEVLFSDIIAEFGLQGEYTVDTTLEEIREAEYKFSPAIIKDLAEEIKNPTII